MAERSESAPVGGRPGLTVEGLCRLLDSDAPGRRVLDLGGAPAAALARAGFRVATPGPAWPADAPRVDAVLCLAWSGRSDADLRRLFAAARRRLVPRGLLVVDHAPDGVPVGGYDAATGRLADGSRAYHPLELAGLVRAAGFAVRRVLAGRPGADGTPPHGTVVASALPAPPGALAVTDWGAPTEPGDAVQLDLRYADDEAEWLDPAPAAAWAYVLDAARRGVDLPGHYPVDDPFGAGRGAAVVAGHFGRPLSPAQVTFAAGVTALLRDLAALADGGPVLSPALVHPDLEAWAAAGGAEVHPVAEPATPAGLRASVRAVRPALVHLDRPTFTADVAGLDEVEALALAAAAVGAPVVLDEAAAPYLGPAGSAVTLVHRVPNLVVLRGFTKAYSFGGLRVGYAVCSAGLADRVRELVTPMQVSEPALAAALRLLAAGDAFARLRERIRTVKPAFAGRLTALGLHVIAGHPDIPWVTVADGDGAAGRLLARRGVRGLRPAPPPVPAHPTRVPLHLTVPLSPRRIALFDGLMPAGTPRRVPA